jgi:hypothetical protein
MAPASVRVCFVQRQQRLQALANLLVAGGGQAQLFAAVEQAFGDFLEGVQVLAQQKHRLGAHALHGQELVGRLADALRQHHQLTRGSDFGSRRVLLQLERGHGFGDFQQVGRLAVDGAQAHRPPGSAPGCWASTTAALRSAASTLGSNSDSWGRIRGPSESMRQLGIARLQTAQVARQHVELSRTSAKPKGCPPGPGKRSWPSAATASGPDRWPPPADRPSPSGSAKNRGAPSTTRPNASKDANMRWCCSAGLRPSRGSVTTPPTKGHIVAIRPCGFRRSHLRDSGARRAAAILPAPDRWRRSDRVRPRPFS